VYVGRETEGVTGGGERRRGKVCAEGEIKNVEYLKPWVYGILRSSDSFGTLGSSDFIGALGSLDSIGTWRKTKTISVRAFLRVVRYCG
jgi:hypothetical protein